MWTDSLAPLLICGLLAPPARGLHLPPYIKACTKGSALNGCAVTNGNEAWQSIIKGDPKYKIPVLSPLKVDQLEINSKSSNNVEINLVMKEVIIGGLEGMKMTGANFDLEKKFIEIEATIPDLAIRGDYKINGKFLVLPINGNGPANITIKNMALKAHLNYKLEKKGSDEFMKLTDTKINYDTSRMYVYFQNLFNGNKQLSDNMNVVLDENWKEFNQDMSPAIAQALAGVMKQILDNIVQLIPYKKIFL